MRILTAALVAMLSSTVVLAQEPIKLSDADRQKVVDEVIEHFRSNPEELVEAIIEWRERQANKGAGKAAQAGADRLPDPISGRRDAAVTIIEFSDYGCGACNTLSATVDEVAKADPDVRIVHRDIPRSSPDAVSASIDLIAAASKGGNISAMRAVYLREGVAPETRIKALAASGVTVETEERRKARGTFEASVALAEKAGVEALPAMIVLVGNKVKALSGPQTKTAILEAIAEVSRAAATEMAK